MCFLEAGLGRHGQVQGPTASAPAVIRLKNPFDGWATDGLLAQGGAGLPPEEGGGDVIHRWGLDEALQQGEVAQEELLEHVAVGLGSHRGVGAAGLQRQHPLHVPQRLKQVEHVGALLVEELAHEGGARPGGGQQKDVPPAPPRRPALLVVVLQAPLHQQEGRLHPAERG